MTDELKPVPCGCGGEAWTDYIIGEPSEGVGWFVCCKNCEIQLPPEYATEAEAITAWNRAMGNGDKPSPDERTVKVISVDKPIEGSDRTIHVTCCEKCERVVGIFDDYCPGCGARLEWE